MLTLCIDLSSLDTSNWIQLISALITLAGIFVSTIISVKTLKQNSKMIEESSRPQIVAFKDVININSPTEYLVIKNFGKSAGTIIEMTYDKKLFKSIVNGLSSHIEVDPLDNVSNITLASGQSLMIPIKTKDFKDKILDISITYKTTNLNKIYTDNYSVNLSQDHGVIYLKQHQGNESKELITISNTLQELVRRK